MHKNILIIKLTSMGDLMHAFPALTDAVKYIPGISFDWVVDENFAEVPLWHPAVNKVIITAHRRWKKNIYECITKREFNHFYRQLNSESYDIIIDLQGNLKSACVSWLRRGSVHGYSSKTCREKPAHWAYDYRYDIPKHLHAIHRQRELMAKALCYQQVGDIPDYGVKFPSLVPKTQLAKKYLVFVHNASALNKLWPIGHWRQLIQRVTELGFSVLLPSGNDKEYDHAQMIATGHSLAIPLKKTELNEMAAIMVNAVAAVCNDTGLSHLAAMTSIPTITLYAATDTRLIGTTGKNQKHIVAEDNTKKARMSCISVEHVWSQLYPFLHRKENH